MPPPLSGLSSGLVACQITLNAEISRSSRGTSHLTNLTKLRQFESAPLMFCRYIVIGLPSFFLNLMHPLASLSGVTLITPHLLPVHLYPSPLGLDSIIAQPPQLGINTPLLSLTLDTESPY